jgi:hypothetical protein
MVMTASRRSTDSVTVPDHLRELGLHSEARRLLYYSRCRTLWNSFVETYDNGRRGTFKLHFSDCITVDRSTRAFQNRIRIQVLSNPNKTEGNHLSQYVAADCQGRPARYPLPSLNSIQHIQALSFLSPSHRTSPNYTARLPQSSIALQARIFSPPCVPATVENGYDSASSATRITYVGRAQVDVGTSLSFHTC